jgi:thioredoxin 1
MEPMIPQCPCSDGGEGVHPLVLLALVVSLWLLVRWIKNTWRKKEVPVMNKFLKVVIVVVLIAVVAVIMIQKQAKSKTADSQPASVSVPILDNPTLQGAAGQPVAKLPRLVDLGADKCIPCKMMAPILEELQKEFASQLQVDFIDVWKNRDAGEKYGVKVIPVQIFYDASGKELFRHEGFFSKEDILAKWKEFGVNLETRKTTDPSGNKPNESDPADQKP